MTSLIKTILSLLIFYATTAYCSSALLIGSWSQTTYLDLSDLPYRVFSVDLNIDSDKKVTGQLCFVSRYGRKIDCPIDFTSVLKKDKIMIHFDSTFGGKNGQGSLQFEKCTLKWQLIKVPEGESYLEKTAILNLDKMTTNQLFTDCIQYDKRNE